MLSKTQIQILEVNSLKPRYFSEIDISARQLHLWLKQIETEKNKSEGKWRTFSPFDVIWLGALRTLKSKTDLALSKHPALIKFLQDSNSFGAPIFSLWANNVRPILITDLEQKHSIADLNKHQMALHPGAEFLAALSLDFALHLSLNATLKGGTSEQVKLLNDLKEQKEINANDAAQNLMETKSQRGTKIKRTKRKLQTNE